MVARRLEATLKKNNTSCAFPFTKIAPFISKADLAFCNLETAIGIGYKPIKKKYTFLTKPKCLNVMNKIGFDIVSLANNHTLDYGSKGLKSTLDHLKKTEIAFSGLSQNDQPQQPVIKTVKGIKIGYLSYADPKAPSAYAKEFKLFQLKPAKALKTTIKYDLTRLRTIVDIVVVSIHWGREYDPVSKHQQTLAQFIIDHGADIIAGHHPHIQQKTEFYKDGVILYSMGNLIFDQQHRPETRISRLYKIIVNKKGIQSLSYLPMTIANQWQTTPDQKEYIQIKK